MSFLAWLIFGILFLLSCGAIWQWLGVRRDARRYPAPGRMIDAGGGARLHLFELGNGGPAVVLESGIAASSLNWRGLQRRLA